VSTPKDRIGFCKTRDGVRLAYSVRGSGVPLVSVSGNWSHLELDPESPVWGPRIAELSRHHALIRFDKRGTGLSDRDVADHCLEAHVVDMETVIDHLGLERFAVAGICGGVAVSVAYAARHPKKVTRLMLNSGYARGRYFRDATAANLAPAFIQMVEVGWDQPDTFVRRLLASSMFIPEASSEIQASFDEAARLSITGVDAARNFRMNYATDVRALAPQIRCPALVLHSLHNELLPFEEGRLLASLIPGARLVPLESRNCLLLADEPAWASWLRETQSFLGQSSPGSTAFEELSPRERDLALLMSEGFDNAQIAARLSISEKTVRNHITHIFAKLNVETRAQAIVLAHRAGIARAVS
jgi:pimeloyl-ACP methyl ester carboxylesterase/DNA-binding CsgD family transcriptional regulator